MRKKRNRLEIIQKILEIVQQKKITKPTHILYKSNLSHKMMQEYLKELIEKNFIIQIEEKDKKRYSITKKGEEYLKEYKSMIKFIDSFGLSD